MGTQIWPCRKTDKGQPRVIIWTNLVDLESMLLYQDSALKLYWFWRRRFLSVFTIYGNGGYLDQPSDQRIMTICINFQSPFYKKVYMKFEEKRPRDYKEEVVQRCGRMGGRRIAKKGKRKVQGVPQSQTAALPPWLLGEAVLTSTHNQCFEQKYEKYQSFYLKFFSFWRWFFLYIWIGVFSLCPF